MDEKIKDQEILLVKDQKDESLRAVALAKKPSVASGIARIVRTTNKRVGYIEKGAMPSHGLCDISRRQPYPKATASYKSIRYRGSIAF